MQKKPNIWFILHALFFVFAVTSVFWLPWYWLAVIFLLLRFQDFIFGGCFLTKLEYGSWNRRYTEENMEQFVPKKSFWLIPLCVDWIFPVSLVFISYLIK